MHELELQEVLALVSELAIAFAGFTGIAAVLGNLSTNGLLRMRIAAIMICAFGTMVLSLLPVALALLAVAETTIWFWSNVMLLALILGPLALWPWVNRLRASHADLFSKSAVVFAYLFPFLGSLFGLFGVVWRERAPGWFIAGLVMYLLCCIFLFVRAIFTARDHDEAVR